MIDWTDRTFQVTDHFNVNDCCYLLQWGRLADETDGLTDQIKEELIKTCQMAEEIRKILGCPMDVDSMFRSQAYSPLVGGSEHDVHTKGIAIDFKPGSHLSIEDAKQLIRPHLVSLGIRMEKGTTTWIHLDRHSVGPSGREFTA